MEGDEKYLKDLIGVDPKSGIGPDPCLASDIGPLMFSYTGVATPTAIEEIKRSAEDTRKLAFQILPPFLESPSAQVRCDAALALAYYGWENSYKYLMPCDSYLSPFQTATVLAIVGDKKAATWIMNKYKELHMTKKPSTTDERKQDNVGKWIFLNALYQFASPEILPFINDVIKENATNYDVKARAINVRKRIYELYPEAKKAGKSK